MIKSLSELEAQASEKGILLRLQERRPLKLWTLKLVAAKQTTPKSIQIIGEMKAWAYGREGGLQLDNLRISPNAPIGIGSLIWAATMRWALESTPCRKARLLAINDNDKNHLTLLRYFKRKGFETIREVKAEPRDLPLRIIWGGAGMLMHGQCSEIYRRNYRSWELARRDII